MRAEPPTSCRHGSRSRSEPDSREALLEELARQGIKHTPENVVAIARDKGGRIVFLEAGTLKGGLRHILEEHGDDFARRGILEEQIADAVLEAVTHGRQVGMQKTRPVYEIEYAGQVQRIAVTVGSNGFLVGANPATK